MRIDSIFFWPLHVRPSKDPPQVVKTEPAHSGTRILIEKRKKLKRPRYDPVPDHQPIRQFNRQFRRERRLTTPSTSL